MAHRGFENHITEETLRETPVYQNRTTKTRTEHVAFSRKKEAEAQAFENMENLEEEEYDCDGVTTPGSICDATGATITYSVNHDYYGNLPEQSTYPPIIENGQNQWFKHVETSGQSSGSCGAVFYRGKNKDGQAKLSWSNPTNKVNGVFTEIAERGHYKQAREGPAWAHVSEELDSNTIRHEWRGCNSYRKSTHSNDARIVTKVTTVTRKEAKG